MAYGVFKFDVAGMKADRTIGIGTGSTILQVALDYAVHSCQLTAYLVVTTSVEIYFEKEVTIGGAY